MSTTTTTRRRRPHLDVWMCIDCGVLAANGEIPDHEERAVEVERGFDAVADLGYIVAIGDSERDHVFSWSACDVCGSTLGGHRFHGALLRR